MEHYINLSAIVIAIHIVGSALAAIRFWVTIPRASFNL